MKSDDGREDSAGGECAETESSRSPTSNETDSSRPSETVGSSRRRVLASVGALAGLAGCTDALPGGSDATPTASGVDGLRLWLHPESGTETNGDTVRTWQDASPNGYDFTQEDGALQPTLVEDAVAGNSALRFDGEDDRFVRRDALGITPDSARTFVVVCRLSDPAARSPYLMQGVFDATGGESNAYGLEANTFNTAGERFGTYLVSVAHDSERSTNTNYNVHVVRTADFPELGAIEESTSYYVNGEEVPIEHTGGGVRNSPFAGESTAIGAFPQSSPSTLMHGEIAEIRVYDRALDEGDRSTVEADLLDTYGI